MPTEYFEQAEKTVLLIEEMFNKAPSIYKLLLLKADILMVVAGLKAGTEINLVGDTYQVDLFDQFRKIVEFAGLRISRDINEGMSYPQFVIYNPNTLRQVTLKSGLVPAYQTSQTLEEWMQQCLDQGYPDYAVKGKLFSYPESAIRDFGTMQKDASLKNKVKSVSRYNETYVYLGPAQSDVLERETTKTDFFNELSKSPTIQRLIDSSEHRQSRQLFREKLDNLIKSRKEESADGRSRIHEFLRTLRRIFLG